MKICESCGYINHTIALNSKKKRICCGCSRIMSEAPQSAPMLGHLDEGGNHHIGLIPQSDEREDK